MTTFSPYAPRPSAVSEPGKTIAEVYYQSLEYAPAAAVRERESDLYIRWERSRGRTMPTEDGPYLVVEPGRRNGGPGPDYLGSVVTFPDGTIRRGDVELHLRQHSWQQHGHQWDRRYDRVILHVTIDGSNRPVTVNQSRLIPTVPLSLAPPAALPCEIDSAPLADFGALDEFLGSLARQRWWRRLSDWRDRDQQWFRARLAERLGPDPVRSRLIELWEQSLPEAGTSYAFVTQVSSVLLRPSNRSRRGQLPGRINLMSALAYTAYHQEDLRQCWSLASLGDLARELDQVGIAMPSRQFLIEVAGNWLYPLTAARGATERFADWYGLPLGWYYGRCRRLAIRLGLPRPRSFGQQQGMLEWEFSLCHEGECQACPVTGSSVGG